jgi:hypothetical protein
MIQCPKCGVRNHPSRRTCVSCGSDLPPEEESRLREIAPDLSEEERQRIVQEERLREHLRGRLTAEVPPVRAHEAKGNMGRAAVLGLILGLVGLAKRADLEQAGVVR